MNHAPQTRRAFLARRPEAPETPEAADLRVLAALLSVERLSLAAAQDVLAGRRIDPRDRPLVAAIREADAGHVAALGVALRHRGRDPRRIPHPPPVAERAARRTRRARTTEEALAGLTDLADVAAGGYRIALAHLHDPSLVRLAGEALGAEAQHTTALRLIGQRSSVDGAVPDAFYSGRRWAPAGGW